MTRKRIAFAGIALGSAIFAIATHVHAASRAPDSPPAEWAQYIDEVRKADAIDNDEARCKAYPDLPGNQWRPGAAQARCTLLRAPAWSLDDIDRLLATPEGVDQLERGFAALLDGHYSDQAQREQIFIAFHVFDDSERAGKVSQRWLELAPDSAYANTAVASHRSNAGWEARGTEYISKTPKAQLDAMTRHFTAAVPLYFKALQIEPRLSVACHRLASIGQQSSDQLQQYATAQCIGIDPESYYPALGRIIAAQPRWGGSDVEMRAAVAYAAARVDRNPILGALLGEAAGYAPSRADNLGDVADELMAVVRMAPSGVLMGYAGRGLRVRQQAWASVVYLSQATRFWPRDAEYRHERAGQLMNLGDMEWALRDQRIAIEEEPDNGWHQYRMGRIVQATQGLDQARPYYQRAMQHSDSRKAAMEQYCQGLVMGSVMQMVEADQCTRTLVEEFPMGGEGWRQRALLLRGNPEGIAAIDKFIEYADPNEPSHQATLPMARQWKAQLQGNGQGAK